MRIPFRTLSPWFVQIFSKWEARKNRLHLSLSAKSNFYLPTFAISLSCRTVYRLWVLMDQFYFLLESGGWGTGKAETEVHTHHRPASRHSAPTTHQRSAFNFFMYRRPTLCTLHIAVDFLKSLEIAVVWGGGWYWDIVHILYPCRWWHGTSTGTC